MEALLALRQASNIDKASLPLVKMDYSLIDVQNFCSKYLWVKKHEAVAIVLYKVGSNGFPSSVLSRRVKIQDPYTPAELVFKQIRETTGNINIVNSLPSTIDIRTEPAGASVEVDGEEKGVTPLTISLQPGKTSKLSFRRVGYEQLENEVVLKYGQNDNQTFTLIPVKGKLKIKSTPSGAEIFVDDLSNGQTPMDIRLPVGKHAIRISKDGYESSEQMVTIEENKPVSVDMKLVKVRQPISVVVNTTGYFDSLAGKNVQFRTNDLIVYLNDKLEETGSFKVVDDTDSSYRLTLQFAASHQLVACQYILSKGGSTLFQDAKQTEMPFVIGIAAPFTDFDDLVTKRAKTLIDGVVQEIVASLDSGYRPDQEELQRFYGGNQDPYIFQIRKSLNGYLRGETTWTTSPDNAIKAHLSKIGAPAGLDSFSKDYYKSRFVPIVIWDDSKGGKIVGIVFLDKPDALFQVLIVKQDDGTYDLREFTRNVHATQNMIDKAIQNLGDLANQYAL